MELRKKVALLLIAVVLFLAVCRECTPQSLRENPFERYLNKPKYGRSKYLSKYEIEDRHEDFQGQKVYNTLNFPEVDQAFDTSSKVPMYLPNTKFDSLFKKSSLSDSDFLNNLRKEKRRKRKYQQIQKPYTREDQPLLSVPEYFCNQKPSFYFAEIGLFPEVQYPLTAAETWTPYYWNPQLSTDKDPQIKKDDDLYQKTPQKKKNSGTFIQPSATKGNKGMFAVVKKSKEEVPKIDLLKNVTDAKNDKALKITTRKKNIRPKTVKLLTNNKTTETPLNLEEMNIKPKQRTSPGITKKKLNSLKKIVSEAQKPSRKPNSLKKIIPETSNSCFKPRQFPKVTQSIDKTNEHSPESFTIQCINIEGVNNKTSSLKLSPDFENSILMNSTMKDTFIKVPLQLTETTDIITSTPLNESYTTYPTSHGINALQSEEVSNIPTFFNQNSVKKQFLDVLSSEKLSVSSVKNKNFKIIETDDFNSNKEEQGVLLNNDPPNKSINESQEATDSPVIKKVFEDLSADLTKQDISRKILSNNLGHGLQSDFKSRLPITLFDLTSTNITESLAISPNTIITDNPYTDDTELMTVPIETKDTIEGNSVTESLADNLREIIAKPSSSNSLVDDLREIIRLLTVWNSNIDDSDDVMQKTTKNDVQTMNWTEFIPKSSKVATSDKLIEFIPNFKSRNAFEDNWTGIDPVSTSNYNTFINNWTGLEWSTEVIPKLTLLADDSGEFIPEPILTYTDDLEEITPGPIMNDKSRGVIPKSVIYGDSSGAISDPTLNYDSARAIPEHLNNLDGTLPENTLKNDLDEVIPEPALKEDAVEGISVTKLNGPDGVFSELLLNKKSYENIPENTLKPTNGDSGPDFSQLSLKDNFGRVIPDNKLSDDSDGVISEPVLDEDSVGGIDKPTLNNHSGGAVLENTLNDDSYRVISKLTANEYSIGGTPKSTSNKNSDWVIPALTLNDNSSESIQKYTLEDDIDGGFSDPTLNDDSGKVIIGGIPAPTLNDGLIGGIAEPILNEVISELRLNENSGGDIFEPTFNNNSGGGIRENKLNDKLRGLLSVPTFNVNSGGVNHGQILDNDSDEIIVNPALDDQSTGVKKETLVEKPTNYSNDIINYSITSDNTMLAETRTYNPAEITTDSEVNDNDTFMANPKIDSSETKPDSNETLVERLTIDYSDAVYDDTADADKTVSENGLSRAWPSEMPSTFMYHDIVVSSLANEKVSEYPISFVSTYMPSSVFITDNTLGGSEEIISKHNLIVKTLADDFNETFADFQVIQTIADRSLTKISSSENISARHDPLSDYNVEDDSLPKEIEIFTFYSNKEILNISSYDTIANDNNKVNPEPVSKIITDDVPQSPNDVVTDSELDDIISADSNEEKYESTVNDTLSDERFIESSSTEFLSVFAFDDIFSSLAEEIEAGSPISFVSTYSPSLLRNKTLPSLKNEVKFQRKYYLLSDENGSDEVCPINKNSSFKNQCYTFDEIDGLNSTSNLTDLIAAKPMIDSSEVFFGFPSRNNDILSGKHIIDSIEIIADPAVNNNDTVVEKTTSYSSETITAIDYGDFVIDNKVKKFFENTYSKAWPSEMLSELIYHDKILSLAEENVSEYPTYFISTYTPSSDSITDYTIGESREIITEHNLIAKSLTHNFSKTFVDSKLIQTPTEINSSDQILESAPIYFLPDNSTKDVSVPIGFEMYTTDPNEECFELTLNDTLANDDGKVSSESESNIITNDVYHSLNDVVFDSEQDCASLSTGSDKINSKSRVTLSDESYIESSSNEFPSVFTLDNIISSSAEEDETYFPILFISTHIPSSSNETLLSLQNEIETFLHGYENGSEEVCTVDSSIKNQCFTFNETDIDLTDILSGKIQLTSEENFTAPSIDNLFYKTRLSDILLVDLIAAKPMLDSSEAVSRFPTKNDNILAEKYIIDSSEIITDSAVNNNDTFELKPTSYSSQTVTDTNDTLAERFTIDTLSETGKIQLISEENFTDPSIDNLFYKTRLPDILLVDLIAAKPMIDSSEAVFRFPTKNDNILGEKYIIDSSEIITDSAVNNNDTLELKLTSYSSQTVTDSNDTLAERFTIDSLSETTDKDSKTFSENESSKTWPSEISSAFLYHDIVSSLAEEKISKSPFLRSTYTPSSDLITDNTIGELRESIAEHNFIAKPLTDNFSQTLMNSKVIQTITEISSSEISIPESAQNDSLPNNSAEYYYSVPKDIGMSTTDSNEEIFELTSNDPFTNDDHKLSAESQSNIIMNDVYHSLNDVVFESEQDSASLSTDSTEINSNSRATLSDDSYIESSSIEFPSLFTFDDIIYSSVEGESDFPISFITTPKTLLSLQNETETSKKYFIQSDENGSEEVCLNAKDSSFKNQCYIFDEIGGLNSTNNLTDILAANSDESIETSIDSSNDYLLYKTPLSEISLADLIMGNILSDTTEVPDKVTLSNVSKTIDIPAFNVISELADYISEEDTVDDNK